LEEIRRGAFREDLFYRLSVIPFEIPPLRERQEDIPLLAQYFLHSVCQEYGKPDKDLSQEAMELLVEYQWPGNVRELRNVIERMVIMVVTRTIHHFDIASSLRQVEAKREVWPTPDGTLREARSRFEREFIVRRLEENQWNVTRTAERLGIERSNLHRKMRAYGIEGSGR